VAIVMLFAERMPLRKVKMKGEYPALTKAFVHHAGTASQLVQRNLQSMVNFHRQILTKAVVCCVKNVLQHVVMMQLQRRNHKKEPIIN